MSEVASETGFSYRPEIERFNAAQTELIKVLKPHLETRPQDGILFSQETPDPKLKYPEHRPYPRYESTIVRLDNQGKVVLEKRVVKKNKRSLLDRIASRETPQWSFTLYRTSYSVDGGSISNIDFYEERASFDDPWSRNNIGSLRGVRVEYDEANDSDKTILRRKTKALQRFTKIMRTAAVRGE